MTSGLQSPCLSSVIDLSTSMELELGDAVEGVHTAASSLC
jgi:hypothetical protein